MYSPSRNKIRQASETDSFLSHPLSGWSMECSSLSSLFLLVKLSVDLFWSFSKMCLSVDSGP
uniref:Dihydropyrimidinase-like 3 n=1 Tax=Mus musculus TaxID=10090 RepID=A0A494BBG3_MOUSE